MKKHGENRAINRGLFWLTFIVTVALAFSWLPLWGQPAGATSLSNETVAINECYAPGAPPAPTDLAATLISATRVDLSWSESSTNVTGFRIEHSTSDDFSSVVTSNVSGAVTAYSDNTVALNNTYYYRVFATNADGDSPASDTVEISVDEPEEPDDLAAVAVSPSQVNLTWEDESNNEDNFRIDRSTSDNFSGAVSFTAPKNTEAYSDSTVAWNNTYYYRVLAVNVLGNSDASDTVPVATDFPAAPTNLTAMVAGPAQINLIWIDNSNNESSFRVERSTAANFTGMVPFTVSTNITSYSDNAVLAGATYYYRVFAVNGTGDSVTSNVVSITVSIPEAPYMLAAASGLGVITLSWSDNSTNETSFLIQRSTASDFTANFIALSSPANVSNYADRNVSAGVMYYYRVSAVNGAGTAPPSNVVNATPMYMPSGGGGGGGGAPPPAPPPPPTNPISVTGLTAPAALRIDSTGVVQTSIQLFLPGGRGSLVIDRGTRMLDANGNPLAAISADLIDSPYPPPPQGVIITAIDFRPNEARFEPPITMILSYNAQTLPAGIKEAQLFIAFWDGKEWKPLESAVNITSSVVAAKVAHFTVFAIMGQLPPPPPPEPARFNISGLSVTPESAKAGETVTVSATVTNAGGCSGKYGLELRVNGVQEATQEVTLNVGASQKVSFAVKRTAPDTYNFGLNGAGGLFTVISQPLAPVPAPQAAVAPVPTKPAPVPVAQQPAVLDTPLLVAIGAIAVVVSGVLIATMRRKPRVKPKQ